MKRARSGLRCGVLGSPVAHSLSPAMHRAAYAALGLEWRYDAVEVPSGSLAAYVDSLDQTWVGLSVTAPLKREAAAYASNRSPIVEQLGVANTLIRDDGGWRALNTDVPGALAALRAHGIDSVTSVRFLGGGSTVQSLLLAVRDLGAVDVEVCVRNPAAVLLEGDVRVRPLDEPVAERVDLLVSTIPAAAVPPSVAANASAVFDVVYDPWPTPLITDATDAGLVAVTGLDLLAHQAALQIGLVTGRAVDVLLLRSAAFAELEVRRSP